MSDDYSEKRQHQRHPLKTEVRVEINGETIIGESQDISMGGISINAGVDFENDAFVQMHVEAIGEMTGHVVRKFDEGFAVEFEENEEEKMRLEESLRTMFNPDQKQGNTLAEDAETLNEKARLEAELSSMFGSDDTEDKK